jgi:PAS domain S-box-containing protein
VRALLVVCLLIICNSLWPPPNYGQHSSNADNLTINPSTLSLGLKQELKHVGVAWQSTSLMSERVLAGVQTVLSERAPFIELEVRPNLPDLATLELTISEFENTKHAMIIMRSKGGLLLSQRGVAIPAFLGAINDPHGLGLIDNQNRAKANISGVTYHLPAKLKIEAFRQVYPDFTSFVLLVEQGHPSAPIDATSTLAAAKELGLNAEIHYCTSLHQAHQIISQTPTHIPIIFGTQALIMDNAIALTTRAPQHIFFSYSEQGVEKGALAGLVADDQKLGQLLGQMLIAHLIDGVSIKELPIHTDPEPRLRLNYDVLNRFESKVPFAIRSLAKSEQTLHQVYKSIPAGIYKVENRIITDVNDYVLSLTGYSREELINHSTRKLYFSDDDFITVAEQALEQLDKTGTASGESRWRHKNGNALYVSMSTTTAGNEGKSTQAYTVIVIDSTNRIQAETDLASRTFWFTSGLAVSVLVLLMLISWLLISLKQRKSAILALRQSEKKLVALFGSMTEMVALYELIFDHHNKPIDYRILDVNQAYTDTMNIPRHALIGAKASAMYAGKAIPFLEEYAQVAISGTPFEYTCHLEEIDKYLRVSVVSPGKKQFATVSTDITDIKKSQDLIDTKNKELETYLFVTTHDLRSPLININGFSRRLEEHLAEILQLIRTNTTLPPHVEQQIEHISTSEVPRTIDFIHTSVNKMDTLLKGLLQISRTGRQILNIGKVNAKSLFQTILKNYQFQLNEIGAKLTVLDLHPCYGDLAQLNTAFSNIIGNAIKYRSPDRPLELQIYSAIKHQRVLYAIADNGIGMSEQHLKRIWDIFYRADANKTEAGDGLGLSIVKRIVEKHEGRAWVKSEKGKGSIFYIELPASEFQVQSPSPKDLEL